MRLAALLSACLLFALTARSASPAPYSVGDYFAAPAMDAPRLSDDGRHVAFLAPLATGRIGVALLDLSTGQVEPLVGGKDEDYDFFFWKGETVVFGGDFGGNGFPALRAIRLSQRKVIRLADTYRERVSTEVHLAQVVDERRHDPEEILVWGNREATTITGFANLAFDYWLLNVRTGKRRPFGYADHPEASPPALDHAGRPRARFRTEPSRHVLEISDGRGAFRVVREFTREEDLWTLAGFDAANEQMYVVTYDPADRGELRTFNLQTGELGPAMFRSASAEIDRFHFAADRGLVGIELANDRPQFRWLDADRAKLQATLDASLPGTVNRVIDSSRDRNIHLVSASSDRDPGTYYVFDAGRTQLVSIGRVNPKLDPSRLQPMEAVSYPARDGQTIPAFLTRPADATGAVPLVILPHGGPYGLRDYWGYDAEVQFLASRGYAVLQPNYRGSSGYGKKHYRAGQLEWGRKMQDDLTDGVRWAIEQGIADPKRVAIVGASYGGYAALAGVTFTPELYCCAVNYVGVTDLAILNRNTWDANRNRTAFYTDWMDNDPASMRARSPVHHVERIQVPTLHAYGENDPRVDIQHWKRLRSELDRHKKRYEFLRLDDEGHGFEKATNRIAFYQAVDAFLARHLAPNATE